MDWRCVSPDALDTLRISGVQEPPNSGARLHEFLVAQRRLLQLYGWPPGVSQESNQNLNGTLPPNGPLRCAARASIDTSRFFFSGVREFHGVRPVGDFLERTPSQVVVFHISLFSPRIFGEVIQFD